MVYSTGIIAFCIDMEMFCNPCKGIGTYKRIYSRIFPDKYCQSVLCIFQYGLEFPALKKSQLFHNMSRPIKPDFY